MALAGVVEPVRPRLSRAAQILGLAGLAGAVMTGAITLRGEPLAVALAVVMEAAIVRLGLTYRVSQAAPARMAVWDTGTAALTLLGILTAVLAHGRVGLSILVALAGILILASLRGGRRTWQDRALHPGAAVLSAAASALMTAWAATLLLAGEGVLLAATSGLAWGCSLAALLLRNGALANTGTAIPALAATRATWRDYLALTKPVIVVLLLVTTLAGMVVGAGRWPAGWLVAWTLLGGALSAGGASALNQYIDRDLDRRMQRTQRRPFPSGRIGEAEGLAFAIALCVAGFYTLALAVNLLSALLSLAGMLYYVVLYSLVLKQSTPQNIVVGGGAGAIPPLVGWAAATGSLSMGAFFLFAIIFFWTPPHFWALALLRRNDYARAGVPMLPVVDSERSTAWQILLYTVQLVALTLLLPLTGAGGGLFAIAAAGFGLGFIAFAWRLWKHGGNRLAYGLYRYSSMYLALIFVALVVDTLSRA